LFLLLTTVLIESHFRDGTQVRFGDLVAVGLRVSASVSDDVTVAWAAEIADEAALVGVVDTARDQASPRPAQVGVDVPEHEGDAELDAVGTVLIVEQLHRAGQLSTVQALDPR
jgi:hypothetical protein